MTDVAICRGCATRLGMPHEALPPVRVTRRGCQSCGGFDAPGLKNYSVDSIQIPGSDDDPNLQAEKEQRAGA